MDLRIQDISTRMALMSAGATVAALLQRFWRALRACAPTTNKALGHRRTDAHKQCCRTSDYRHHTVTIYAFCVDKQNDFFEFGSCDTRNCDEVPLRLAGAILLLTEVLWIFKPWERPGRARTARTCTYNKKGRETHQLMRGRRTENTGRPADQWIHGSAYGQDG